MPLGIMGIFVGGVLTFFTPCVLPMVPIYLAALTGGSVAGLAKAPRGQLLARAAFFAVGFVVVFALMGLAASSVGGLVLQHKTTIQTLGGVFVLLFALKFLGVVDIPWLDRVVRGDERRFHGRLGWLNALLMGFIFAAGWSPCVGPVLGTVLTYAATNVTDPLGGALYLTVYGVGFATPLLVTAGFAEVVLNWLTRIRPFLPKIERAIGALLLVVAGSLLFDWSGGTTNPMVSTKTASPALAPAKAVAPAPRLMEFFSPSCPICVEMKPVVKDVVEDCTEHRVDVHAVNVNLSQNYAVRDQYRIVGLPTFIFLDANGTETARLVGRQSTGALTQALSTLTGLSCPGVGLVPRMEGPLNQAPFNLTENESCPSTSTNVKAAGTSSRSSDESSSETSQSCAPSAAANPSTSSPDSP